MTGRVVPGPWERPVERRRVILDAAEWGLILAVLDETGGVSARMAAHLIRGQLDPSTSGHPAPTTSTGGKPMMELDPRFVAVLMGLPQDWLTPCISEGTV